MSEEPNQQAGDEEPLEPGNGETNGLPNAEGDDQTAPPGEEPVTWTPHRGLLAKTVAWIVLGVLVVCVVALAVALIKRGFK